MKHLIKLIMCAFLAIASVSNTLAFTKTKPNVEVNGQTFKLDGKMYNSSEFHGCPNNLSFLEVADFIYIFPLPEGDSDYCEIYTLNNGNYAVMHGYTYYEFNSKKCKKTPQKYTDTCKVSNCNIVSDCEVYNVDPFSEGKKVVYMYTEDKENKTYIVVFGKK